MSDAVLLVEREAPIAVVTLNRPQRMNALSTELRLAIESDPEFARTHPEIRDILNAVDASGR